ncbi:MAG: Hsp70 family protein [Phycisphaerales bacterium]|nr:Hsp70 family protein [Phycisphaerales bacterium]
MMGDMQNLAGPIVGIDLGTTNSLVAVAGWPAPGDGPRVLVDEAGRGLFPSAVRFEASGATVAGHEAKARAVEFPLRTIVSVKRLMGRSLQDATADLKYLSYEVVEGENKTARVRIPAVGAERSGASGVEPGVGGAGVREVSPQEVSAIVLRELKELASRALGVLVSRAVITVPAYFDDAQRQATRDAARLAGLEAVRLVAEPTAAALAYGLGMRSARGNGDGATRDAKVVAVYDLGGGTFDVSVLRITPSMDGEGGAEGGGAEAFQVLSTSGDTHLGGDDFDYALVSLFTREIGERFFGGRDVGAELSPTVRRALRDFAERTKIRLSEADEARVDIDLGEDTSDGAGVPPASPGQAETEEASALRESAGGRRDACPTPGKPARRVYSRVITRAEFEAMIEPLVERTIGACKRAMRDAKRMMEGEVLAAVVMVGGSTRVPRVRARVKEVFGVEPYVALDPDVVVALGAAVQGSVLSGARRDALLLDVVPLSLGIETAGGAFAKIVMRGATIPAMAGEMFSTQVDGQTAIKLQVLQGEREMAADCRSLGTYHLRGIPPMPAGIPQLRVEFRVDSNGVLSVSAMERRSGKRLDVQIVPTHGLTREEVDRLERESFTHAREDMRRHRLADLVANSKLDLHWIGQQMTRHGAKLSAESRGAIEVAIGELRELVERASDPARSDGVEPDAFQQAKERLDRASVGLHEVSISESLREG